MRRLVVVLAVALGALAAWAAVRAGAPEPTTSPERELAARFVEGLIDLQGEDGAFDPFPDDPGIFLIKRTGPHALATAALARARTLGLEEEVPALPAALDGALDVLLARQEPGGTFGAMPPAQQNPWPSLEATAAGTLALLWADRPGDRQALSRSAAALQRAVTYDVREGWTKGLVVMALAAIDAAGESRLVGGDVRGLVDVGEEPRRIDCNDYRLSAAIARRVAGMVAGVPTDVLTACLADPLAWGGQTSDVPSWWMQAWLAARLPVGAGFWPGLRRALAEAAEAPPPGRIGDGWYADAVSQTASAVLALGEGLAPLSERR